MDPRALLDELMGADRNMSSREKAGRQPLWKDKNVCRLFLGGFCPNFSFESTRMSLPVCTLSHSTAIQNEFQVSASLEETLSVKSELLIKLEELENERLMRIRKAKERLVELGRTAERDEQALRLGKEIERCVNDMVDLVGQAEVAGEAGDIDLVELSVQQMDALKTKKQDLEYQKRKAIINAAGVDHGKQSICEICGSITTEIDKSGNERHLTGKYHTGWITIQEKIQELRNLKKKHIAIWPTAASTAIKDQDLRRERDSGDYYSREGDDKYSRDYRDRDRERDGAFNRRSYNRRRI